MKGQTTLQQQSQEVDTAIANMLEQNKQRIKLAEEIKAEMGYFIGTEQYHKNIMGLIWTDGIKWLSDKAKAWWLVDLVSSYQPRLSRKGARFQLWKIKIWIISGGNKATVTCQEDTGMPIIVKQELEYTNFPLDEFEFYVVDGVMMLKSEY